MPDFLCELKSGYQNLNIKDSSILLAVSGGADSIALLLGSIALRNDLNLKIIVAHLNHQLRGTTSDDDADWLYQTCESLKIPLIMEKQNIAQFAKENQIGIEEAARKARYQFLQTAAKDNSCPFLAVAHTSNDQAETVLHHILRGTGISGLQGIPRSRSLSNGITVIRPMLSASRESVEIYLNKSDQKYRTDESNSDSKWTRNRIRNNLLPLLQGEFNPKIDEALLRLSNQSVENNETIEFIVNDILQKAIIDFATETVRLKEDILSVLPRNLIRECFRTIWKRKNWPLQRMGFTEWEKLAEITTDGGSYTFPGTVIVEKRHQLLICRREVKSSAE